MANTKKAVASKTPSVESTSEAPNFHRHGGAPNLLDRSYTITAEIDIPQGGAEGMLVTALRIPGPSYAQSNTSPKIQTIC